VVEPLITLAKIDGDANRRLAFARLRDAEVSRVVSDLGPRFKARPVAIRGSAECCRAGDSAPMALMQLVERPPRRDCSGSTGRQGRRAPVVRRKLTAAATEGEAAPQRTRKKKARCCEQRDKRLKAL